MRKKEVRSGRVSGGDLFGVYEGPVVVGDLAWRFRLAAKDVLGALLAAREFDGVHAEFLLARRPLLGCHVGVVRRVVYNPSPTRQAWSKEGLAHEFLVYEHMMGKPTTGRARFMFPVVGNKIKTGTFKILIYRTI